MTSSIGQSIDALCTEHGLDRDMIIEAMKDAVRAAARKQFKAQDKTGESIQVDWNNEEGMIEISAQKEVVEEVENPQTELSLVEAQEMAGDEIEIGDMLLLPLPPEELGRIAAQTAKQILVQKVREAVREKVYDEYIDRKGELINGTVKRFERGDMIIDLGNNLEAVLPRREQVRSENWNQGERIRVVIAEVTKDPKGQQIIASRASAQTSASMHPPPTVPATLPFSRNNIFAPRCCGVEPRVCATVATTTRSPRSLASLMAR